jgi:hypothetical protein
MGETEDHVYRGIAGMFIEVSVARHCCRSPPSPLIGSGLRRDVAATLASAPDVPRQAGTGSRPRRCSSARGSDLGGVASAADGGVAAVCSAGSFPRLGQLC